MSTAANHEFHLPNNDPLVESAVAVDLTRHLSSVPDLVEYETPTTPVPAVDVEAVRRNIAEEMNRPLASQLKVKSVIPKPDTGYSDKLWDDLQASIDDASTIAKSSPGYESSASMLIASAFARAARDVVNPNENVTSKSGAPTPDNKPTPVNLVRTIAKVAKTPETSESTVNDSSDGRLVATVLPVKAAPKKANRRLGNDDGFIDPKKLLAPRSSEKQGNTSSTDTSASKMSRRERRQTREERWATERDLRIDEEFNRVYEDALRTQSRAAREIENLGSAEYISDYQEVIKMQAQELVDRARNAHSKQKLQEEGEAKAARFPERAAEQREVWIASRQLNDPIGLVIEGYNGRVDLARKSYAAAVADKRGSTVGRSRLGGEIDHAVETNESSRVRGALGKIGINLPESDKHKIDPQLKYEIKVGVLQRLIREDVAFKNPDADPSELERLQKEAILSRMLIDGWTKTDGRKQAPELLELNKQIAYERKMGSGHYSYQWRGTKVEPRDKRAEPKYTTQQEVLDKFRRARLGFYRNWNRWSHQGLRGAAIKATVGVGLAGVGVAAGALGLTASVASGGLGLAAGAGIALRLSRTLAVSHLEKRADRVQADTDAENVADKYEKLGEELKDQTNLPDIQPLDINGFSKTINADFTREAHRQARKNKVRLVVGAAGVAGAVGAGSLIYHFANGSGVTQQVTGKGQLGVKPKVPGAGVRAGGGITDRQPGGAGQGHTQVGGRSDVVPASKTPGVSGNHGQPAGPGQGHSQVNGSEVNKPSVAPGNSQAGTGSSADIPKTTPTVAPSSANIPTIDASQLNGGYVAGAYDQMYGAQGFAQMQADAQAAIAHGDLLKVTGDDNDWYYALTDKGARAVGAARGSSQTSDVMRVLSQSGKFKIAA